MKKEIINKEKILKIILVIFYSIFVIMIVNVVVNDNNKLSNYKITKNECNRKADLIEEPKEIVCKSAGYYIDNNKVNISLGNINCANDIKIEEIEVDEDMNVYIKAKEKKGKNQAKCVCNPSLTIEFDKTVESVIFETEDGNELNECNS